MKITDIRFLQSVIIAGQRRVEGEYKPEKNEWRGWEVWADDHFVYFRTPHEVTLHDKTQAKLVTRLPASICAVTYADEAKPEPKRRGRPPKEAQGVSAEATETEGAE